MGLLDLPAPVFAWVDAMIGGGLPPTARLILWGVVGGIVSMALYWALSPQARIERNRTAAAEARRALDAYDGEFAGAMPLIGGMLRLSLKQIGLVFWPALAASLPVLCLIVWVSTAYGNSFPPPDAAVDVRTTPAELQGRWVGGAEPPPRIVVADGSGRTVEEFALQAPVGTLHKRVWWNALIGNPAGYLPAEGPVERVEIDLPQREYLPFGPTWLRGWEAMFFVVLVASSVAVKLGFRIA